MVANPDRRGPSRPAEAVLTIGWGGVEPARPRARRLQRPASARPTTATPACWPPTTSRCGSRPRPTAPTRSPGCCPSPSRSPRARTRREPRRGSAHGGFVEPAYGERSLGDVLPAVGARPSASTGSADPPTGLELPDGAGVRRVPRRRARRTSCCAATPTPRRTSHSLLADREPGTAGVPSTTATSLTSLGTGLTPGRARAGRLHLAGARHRPAAQRAALGQGRRPAGVAAAPDGVRAAARRRGARRPWSTSASSPAAGLTAGGAPRGGRTSAPTRSASGSPRRSLASARAALADLRLRRRPRLDRPPLRRRLDASGCSSCR